MRRQRGNPAKIERGMVVVQVLLCLAGIGFWLYGRTTAVALPNSPPPSPLTAVEPTTLESAYELAFARATQWHAEARPLSFSAQVDWPLDPVPGAVTVVPSGGWLTYVFVAPAEGIWRDDSATLMVSVERYGGRIATERVMSWEGRPAAVPTLDSYPIDSSRAVLVAEAAGGTAFRNACPVVRHMSRIGLDQTDPESPTWVVGYIDTRQPDRFGFKVRVDATSGDVVRITGKAVACEER